MPLQSDPSLDGFNSFVSIEEADAYFSGLYHTGKKWSELDPQDQEALLITATRRLDSLPWGGRPFYTTQAMSFPRSFGYHSAEYGTTFSSDVYEIPQWLKNATCEMAHWIWTEDERTVTDSDFALLKSSKEGPLSYEFRDGALPMPPRVMAILNNQGPLVIDFGSGPKSRRMVL